MSALYRMHLELCVGHRHRLVRRRSRGGAFAERLTYASAYDGIAPAQRASFHAMSESTADDWRIISGYTAKGGPSFPIA